MIRFRRVEAHEAARLSAFMRRLFLAAYGHCSTHGNVERFLDGVYTPEQQAAELANPHIDSVVMESDGGWAGFTQLRFAAAAHACVPFDNGAELGRIYLDPRFQGRTLGAQLLAHAESIARARGRDGFWLNVWQEAPQAIAFYRKQGYDIVGTTLFVVGDDPKTDWVMAKRFAAA